MKVIFRDGISRCDLRRCISRLSEAGVSDRTLAKGTTAHTKTWSRIGKDLMCVSTVQAGDKRGAGRSAELLCSNTHVLAFDQQPRSKKTHGAH